MSEILRSDGKRTQVDTYLVALKLLGIPVWDVPSFDGAEPRVGAFGYNSSTDQLMYYSAEGQWTAVQPDRNFIYTQASPSAEWDITHNLNKRVSVTVVDSAGTVVEGDVVINSGTRVVISFNKPFAGEAYLN